MEARLEEGSAHFTSVGLRPRAVISKFNGVTHSIFKSFRNQMTETYRRVLFAKSSHSINNIIVNNGSWPQFSSVQTYLIRSTRGWNLGT